MSEVHQVRDEESARIMAIVAWVLLIVGWPTLHLTSVAAVILAYIQRDDTRGTVWESHYEALINTFWTGLVVGIVSVLLCFVVVGIPILIGLVIWVLYRSIRGLIHAIESRPY